MERRRTLRTVGGAVLVVVLSGSVGWADGGDPNKVHACIAPATTRANVVIVGPNEACPTEFPTAVHWPANSTGVFQELPPPGKDIATEAGPIAESLSPSKKLIKKLYAPLGLKPNFTKLVTKTSANVPGFEKGIGIVCPSTHPFRMSGGYSVSGLNYWLVAVNAPVGLHGWVTGIYAGVPGTQTPWTLTVSIVCAKTA